MYKALHLQTGEEIIILHPAWKGRIPELRAMDRAGLLVCQGCMQPLRVKAGQYKRAHFAHKHLKACSYGAESPAILNARAVLYEWLVEQFGLSVTLEKKLDQTNLPRPVDCWVETERGTFAYWIIEAGIKLEPRKAILAAFEHLPVHLHPVFLQSMLNEEKKEFHSVLLTPTERAFLRRTAFDDLSLPASVAESDALCGTLHYLDADSAGRATAALTTYRGLTLYHRPNWFRGAKKTSPLSELRASPQDGEFIHPGELARLSAHQEKQQRLEIKRRQYEHSRRQYEHSHPEGPAPQARGQGWDLKPPAGSAPEPLPCALCGQITNEYWSTFFNEQGRKLCRCRECLERL